MTSQEEALASLARLLEQHPEFSAHRTVWEEARQAMQDQFRALLAAGLWNT